MRSVAKYLICFCIVLSGVATLQVHHVHGESALSSVAESTLCRNVSALNVLQKDESFFRRLLWIAREKVTKAHSAPLIERRENEEDDDESFAFRTRFSACISSVFFNLVSGDALARTHALPDYDLQCLLPTGRYILLQVFRI